MIIMENISKCYKNGGNSLWALRDVSLYVEKGSFCSIVGASGSGKSTLLNIAGCLDIPSSGTYFLDNEEICTGLGDRLSKIRRDKIGFVFQNFNLLKGMTALENVCLPLIISGVARSERTEMAKRALELVGLENRMGHRANELSGGQQQRVALARAVVREPDLILADEPTGNLDLPSGNEIMRLLKKLNKGGSTVLMITHDLNKARLSDKIIKIKEGKIER